MAPNPSVSKVRHAPFVALLSLAVALFLAACGAAPPGGGGGGGDTTCNEYREGTFTIVFDGRTYTNAAAESYGGANATQTDGVVGLTLNSDQGDQDDYLRFSYAKDSTGRVLAVTEAIGGVETLYGYVEGSPGGSIASDTFTPNFGDAGFCAGLDTFDGTATGSLTGVVSELLVPANTKSLDISGVEVIMFDVSD